MRLRIPAGTKKRTAPILLLTAALAGCGSSSGATSSPSAPPSVGATSTAAPAPTSTAAGVNPNQRETLPPGDIPDTIAYVPFTVQQSGAKLTVSAPEGWSRSAGAGTVTFTDKLNQIQLFASRASAPVTVATARSTVVPKLTAAVKGFQLQSVTTVQRPAGAATRTAYLGDSAPNPVTGKVGVLAFERYDFYKNGRDVTVLLSSPQGSDNVDPWRKVTTSLKVA